MGNPRADAIVAGQKRHEYVKYPFELSRFLGSDLA